MSGLHCYTYVWIENLYLDLVSLIIPSSGFFKFDFRHLYLLLVCNVIPTSVMATSAFAKLDLRHVIPTSGIGKRILYHRLLYLLTAPPILLTLLYKQKFFISEFFKNFPRKETVLITFNNQSTSY